jgi:hypothetical protein
MKLRLRGNTLRLRLLQKEVAALAEGQTVSEILPTTPPFGYTVEPAAVSEIEVLHEAGLLRTRVPEDWARGWNASEEVGRQAVTGGIDVLIEKDWACTTPRPGERNDGAYPNPNYASE